VFSTPSMPITEDKGTRKDFEKPGDVLVIAPHELFIIAGFDYYVINGGYNLTTLDKKYHTCE